MHYTTLGYETTVEANGKDHPPEYDKLQSEHDVKPPGYDVKHSAENPGYNQDGDETGTPPDKEDDETSTNSDLDTKM